MTESNQGEERRVLMMALSLNATMFVVGIVASVIAKSTLDGAQQGDSAETKKKGVEEEMIVRALYLFAMALFVTQYGATFHCKN